MLGEWPWQEHPGSSNIDDRLQCKLETACVKIFDFSHLCPLMNVKSAENIVFEPKLSEDDDGTLIAKVAPATKHLRQC